MVASAARTTLERDLRILLGRSAADLTGRVIDPVCLKRAYRRRAREFHPDMAMARGADPEYLAERFRALSDAYLRVLSLLDSSDGPLILVRQRQAEAPRRPVHGSPRPDARTAQNSGARPMPRRATGPAPQAARVFHSGAMPRTKLRFAQFLYYSKRIDWETLIRSLSWQYRFRPKLGEIGAGLGYLSEADIPFALSNRRPCEPFGAALLRLGLVDPFKLTVMLGRQRLLGLPIGRYFVDNGHLPQEEIDAWLEALRLHNLRQAAPLRDPE